MRGPAGTVWATLTPSSLKDAKGGPTPTVHPIVRVHPWTRRPALFLARAFVRGVDGMTKPESE